MPKKWLKFSMAGICFMVLMALIILLQDGIFKYESSMVTLDGKHTFGNTPNSINNGGNVAYDDKYIYYTANDKHDIMKKRRDNNSDAVKIASTFGVQNLNVTDEYIYYTKQNEKIERIRKDGSEPITIYNHKNIHRFIIIDNLIYCMNDDALVRMKLDGSMCETILNIGVGGNRILYEDENLYCSVGYSMYYESFDYINTPELSQMGIWKINLNTLKTERIYEGLVYSPIIYKKHIYFSTSLKGNLGLYSMSLETLKLIKISNVSDFSYECLNQYKDYLIVGSGLQLYRMNYDGTNIDNLVRGAKAYVIDDIMYYSKDNMISPTMGSEIEELNLTKQNFEQEITIAKDKGKHNTANTPSNINNCGRVAYDDKYIYYTADYNSALMKKSRFDNSEPVLIAKTSCAANLNVTNKYIYYTNEGEEIVRIRKEGSGPTQIYSKMMINSFFIIDSWIYCLDDDGVVRMNLDGTERKTILDIRCLNILYEGDSIYCSVGYFKHDTYEDIKNLDSSQMGIWKINIDTLKTERIYEGLVYAPILFKNQFYFSAWDKEKAGMCFYRMAVDTLKPVKVSDNFYQSMNQYKDYLIVRSGNQMLRMNSDGTNIVFLAKGDRAYVIDDILYYSYSGSKIKELKLTDY